jgi:hypothetical protein
MSWRSSTPIYFNACVRSAKKKIKNKTKFEHISPSIPRPKGKLPLLAFRGEKTVI